MAQKFYNDELIINKGVNNLEFDLIHSYKDILSNAKIKRVQSNNILSNAKIAPRLVQYTITSEAIVKQVGIQHTTNSNSTVVTRSTSTIESNARVKYVSQKYLLSNSTIKVVDIQNEVISDSKVVTRDLKDISSDSIIKYIIQQNIHSNTYVTHTRSTDILSDSKIVIRSQKDVLSDSVVKIIYYKDILTNSKIKHLEITNDVLSDSLIHHQSQENITSDSKIKKLGVLQDVLTNSKVKQLGVQQLLSSDTNIIYQINQYLLSDTKIKKLGVQQDILDDSKVVRRYQQNINSNAYIRYAKDFYGRLRAQVNKSKDFYIQLKVDQPAPVDATNVQAFDMYTGEGIKITWEDVGNYGYNLYLYVGGSWVKQNQAVIKTNYYIVGGLSANTEYEFKLAGVNGQGDET